MRMRKIKAFTLAELLVIMAVLAVLMAAFAPMFTSRYTNIATGAVWRKVPADNNGHIYSDAPNKFLLQPSFIGISPQTPEEAKNNYKPYSKVIINSTANNQKQVDFNYNGEKIGSLYALNKNILMGGSYSGSLSNPEGKNTAYGYNALNSLTSGSNNTAVGYNALSSLNSGEHNTAIGWNADIGNGTKGNAVIRNVTVGYFSHSATGRENVIIRNKKQSRQISDITSRNIVIGNDTTFVKGAQSTGNVLVGNAASVVGNGNSKSALASYNTAIGANATTPLGSYNTSIGYDSGKQLSAQHNKNNLAHNVTIIDNKDTSSGLNLGAVLNIGDNYNSQNAKYTHVYIGNGTYYGPAALEVHSGFDKISSVLVNGDLIVRGQTYLNSNDNIVAMTVDPYNGKLVLSDHTERNRRMRKEDPTKDDGRGMIHEKYAGYEGCVCSENINTYNWTDFNAIGNPKYLPFEAYNTNLHYGKYMYNGNDGDSRVILDAAHMRSVQDSCCPNLQVSDARLKNIGEKFTPSYDELLKLAIYNYSYKTEGKKPTRVGVIAQDLKRIFPNAVSKDQNGYLKIRWDEMFYAMVNAIKDLNAKVQDLVAKVETNKTKINNLKADNKKLEQKLDDLAKEIAKLEK